MSRTAAATVPPRAQRAARRAERETAPTPPATPVAPAGGPAEIALDLIDEAEAFNPRTRFAAEELAELARDIAARGVLQPILLRPHPDATGRYLVTAGARRRRAALAAGLTTIPALVRDQPEADAFEAAVAENLQRQDVTPLEEARAFQRIIAARQAADPDLKLKDAKAAIAEVIAKSPRFVELRLQLLDLPAIKQVEIEEGKTTAKEAILWMRDRPKARDLKPDVALAVLEVAWAISKRKNAALYERAHVRHDYPEQIAPGLIAFGIDCNDLTSNAALTNGAFAHLQAVTGADLPLVRHNLEPYVRAARIAALPDLDGPERAARIDELFRTDGYLTTWLNGPFEPHPERKAERDRQRSAEDARRQQYQREDEERRAADREAHAKRQREEAANAERAEGMLAKIRAFEDEIAGATETEFVDAFRALLGQFDYAPPFAVTWSGREVCLRDSVGVDWAGTPHLLEGLRRLMAIALNRALGFAAISGPELDDTPWAEAARRAEEDTHDEARQAFLDKVQALLEDATDDNFEAHFPGPVSARQAAGRALAAWERDEGIRFGDPSVHWDDTATELAEAILGEGYGQPTADDDDPDDNDDGEGGDETEAGEPEADDEDDTPAFLKRLAGVQQSEASQ